MPAKTAVDKARVIGPYQVLEKLGQGGMGSVYKAYNPGTGQVVALKLLNPEFGSRPYLLKRFEREFRTARLLDHPYLVRSLDFGQHGGSPYLVMEFVDGPSLGEVLEREKKLPPREAITYIIQVAEALQVAHHRKIVHRDVKPDNILLDRDGRARLTDLGLAKDLDDEVELTRSGISLGTPHFMAPEQLADAKNADHRSDIYGLGATLYQAITGELPFHARGAMTICKKKMIGELTPPRRLVADLEPHVEAAILRALNPDPARRFESCDQFIEALLGITAGSSRGSSARLSRVNKTERRVALRLASNRESSCRAALGERKLRWPARLRDVSQTGLGLLTSRRFEPGTLLTVELADEAHNNQRQFLVRVVHVRPTLVRKWVIGACFDRRLSDEELSEWLPAKVRPAD